MISLATSWPVPAVFPKLAPDEVHVWCVSLACPPHSVAELAETLTPDERARVDYYHSAAVRTQFVVTRAVLRRLLGTYLDAPAPRISFRLGPQGKPALADWGWLHFNVTHSHDVALIAVTPRGEVGVDVERVRHFPNDLGMAERYFSPNEAATLRRLAGELRRVSFFHAWTRKEAFLKASGKGLSFGLERVEVTMLPGEEPRFVSIDGDAGRAREWSLRHLTPAPGCVGALALPTHDYRLRCWQWQDD